MKVTSIVGWSCSSRQMSELLHTWFSTSPFCDKPQSLPFRSARHMSILSKHAHVSVDFGPDWFGGGVIVCLCTALGSGPRSTCHVIFKPPVLPHHWNSLLQSQNIYLPQYTLCHIGTRHPKPLQSTQMVCTHPAGVTQWYDEINCQQMKE